MADVKSPAETDLDRLHRLEETRDRWAGRPGPNARRQELWYAREARNLRAMMEMRERE